MVDRVHCLFVTRINAVCGGKGVSWSLEPIALGQPVIMTLKRKAA